MIAKPRSTIVGRRTGIYDDGFAHPMSVSHLKNATDVIPVFDRTVEYHEITARQEGKALLDDFRIRSAGFALKPIGNGNEVDIDRFQQGPEFLVIGLGVGGIEKIDSVGKKCALHGCLNASA